MLVSPFNASRQQAPRRDSHTYDRDSDCYLLPVAPAPIFRLAAVADVDQPGNRTDHQDRVFHQHQHCGNHFAPLHPREHHRIDRSVAKSAVNHASDVILLASIIVLAIFALTSITAVKQYERQLAAEARV